MPEYHRRYAHQMTEKYTFQSEMAEEYQCVIVCLCNSVIVSFTDISMLSQKLIKFSGYIIIIAFGVSFL